jgi:hypothetical protein
MDLQMVEKKLREARFFLDKMIDRESTAFGDKEQFDFNLSAFLNAARTVDYRLRHEHKATYEPWREKWDANLTTQDAVLIKFMVDDRIRMSFPALGWDGASRRTATVVGPFVTLGLMVLLQVGTNAWCAGQSI